MRGFVTDSLILRYTFSGKDFFTFVLGRTPPAPPARRGNRKRGRARDGRARDAGDDAGGTARHTSCAAAATTPRAHRERVVRYLQARTAPRTTCASLSLAHRIIM